MDAMENSSINDANADSVSTKSEVSLPPKYEEFQKSVQGPWHTNTGGGTVYPLPPSYCDTIPVKVDTVTGPAIVVAARPVCRNRVRRACAGAAIACIILAVVAICLGIGLGRVWPSSSRFYGNNVSQGPVGATAMPGSNMNPGNKGSQANVVNPPTPCGTRSVPANTTGAYIVNGQLAARGAWPWQVSIIYNGGFMSILCGGSLLSDRWVLTAASCAQRFSNTNMISIRIGSLLITGLDSDAQMLGVDKIFINPNYSNNLVTRNTVVGDVALLHLSSVAVYTDTVRPICYPATTVDPQQYKVCVATGFGDLSAYQTIFEVTQNLMQGAMQPMTSSACLGAFTSLTGKTWQATTSDFNNFFCAGSTVPGSANICMGDGGGPLACRDQSGVWSVVGVSSFVVKACQLGVFSTVSNFSSWIKTTMAYN